MNQRVAAGTPHDGDRTITVHMVRPDHPVPVDYLFFRNKQQMQPVIEAGRRHARAYLKRQGLLT